MKIEWGKNSFVGRKGYLRPVEVLCDRIYRNLSAGSDSAILEDIFVCVSVDRTVLYHLHMGTMKKKTGKSSSGCDCVSTFI